MPPGLNAHSGFSRLAQTAVRGERGHPKAGDSPGRSPTVDGKLKIPTANGTCGWS
jgi:hypothetical protein